MIRRESEIESILSKFQNDPSRLMDILWACHEGAGYVSKSDLTQLSAGMGVSVAHIQEVLSFYHFFRQVPSGRRTIYLDNSIIAQHAGMSEIKKAFETELGIKVGGVTEDGQIGLFETSCIGMSDQSPAALIDFLPVTQLTVQRVREICKELKSGLPVQSHVSNYLRSVGLFINWSKSLPQTDSRAVSLSASEILNEIKASGLRGCGGAGFSTGKKWEICKSYESPKKYVICNADEGEPGTFKDRVLLDELPDQLLEGMAIAGKCIGSSEGIIYLRAEYRYLLKSLQVAIQKFRSPIHQMNFRIQLGAGAYVCGEESALLESLEGKRGEPRIKPPFPVEKGYHGYPTIVNNVETFVLAAEVMRKSVDEFRSHGTLKSPGVRLLSVSGDVGLPGIYEVPWGISVADVLLLVQAQDPALIQIGGPSGVCISLDEIDRRISFEDLPTGGSLMVFSQSRDKFEILLNFMNFFVAESCGNCTPCRAGNVILRDLLLKFKLGYAQKEDIDKLKQWSNLVSKTSRCGLGATSPNVLTSSLKAFPDLYQSGINQRERHHYFDLSKATAAYDSTIQALRAESAKP